VAWQQEHAEVIGVLRWLTPVGSIQSVMKLLTRDVESISDIGLLGGLPFGVIAQVLDGQGIIDLNTPYVNPKTGKMIPDYIPQSEKARAAAAVEDFIMSIFTYPGRIIGLPGKGELTRKFTETILGDRGEFEADETDELTEKQKQRQDQIFEALGLPPREQKEHGAFDGYYITPGPVPTKIERPEQRKKPEKRSTSRARSARSKNFATPPPGAQPL
jgi:hypothetical protein